MKALNISLIVAAVLIIAFLTYFAFFKKEAKGIEKVEEKPAPQALPPPVQQADNNKPLFVDSGEGLVAVNSRMKTLYNSADFQAIKNAEINKLFVGLSYANGMKAGLTNNFGSLSKIPVIPTFIDSSFANDFQGIESVVDFEQITKVSGINAAFTTWRSALNIQGYDFYPANLQLLVDSAQFGMPTPADKNKSERYNAFTVDFKKLAANMIKLCNDLSESLRRKAIFDLVDAGWKFVGETGQN